MTRHVLAFGVVAALYAASIGWLAWHYARRYDSPMWDDIAEVLSRVDR